MNLLQRLMSAVSGPPAASPRPVQMSQRPRVSVTNAAPPHVPGTTVYRSRDGTSHFRFRIEAQEDGEYRIYIVEQPEYEGRNADGHATHRYKDAGGNHFICWDGQISTVGEARGIAQDWSEQTLKYIRFGTPFDEGRND